MDPLQRPAETEMMEREADKDARRKIQFSVPSSVPTQLDPRQVEMRMAQAHLSSLDMSSVDKEDPSSGEEDEKCEKDSQQIASATGGLHFFLSYPGMCTTCIIAYTLKIPCFSDLREESKPLKDQRAPPDSLTGCADLSRHQGDEEEAKEREAGKGE
ncbi:hypothetical protein GBF38_010254 [Nibea albiflora]|uniref:Uncharacterized protein n=1 Tax=Nibea albiflora TaxID=240163 RepID=A0ACB7F2Q9_NIBAL|nr:hypothetical protein GBF38_010254 [Nibea albiflora]